MRSLLWGLGIVTALYMLINLAYLKGLGLAGMAQSQAVAADLLKRALGEPGAVLISLLVVVCTIDSINATIFTGARTNFALGQDVAVFRFLGVWQDGPNTPTTAYLLQGAISLALVGLGTITRDGFKTMVDYTAPIFWFFFLLSSLSLLVLRVRDPDRLRPFRVPLYPILPPPVVNEMLRLANVKKNDVLYDLGSGDGRIVITAAQKFGTRGVGIDIDPQRIQEAKQNAQKAGVTDLVQFRQQNLFETDFSKATVVTLYLLPDINLKLRPRLLSQLRPGTRIVSHAFDMGDWKPQKVVNVAGQTVYYWTVPQKASKKS